MRVLLWVFDVSLNPGRAQTDKGRKLRQGQELSGVAVSHTDDPACGLLGEPGAEATKGPCSQCGGSKLSLLLWDAKNA